MIFVYIPCKDDAEAKDIAKALLEQKTIACANMFPINSVYFWEGKLSEEPETVLLCKTTTDRYDTVTRIVKDLHSYDTPAIIKIEVDANKEYTDWLERELSR